MAYAKERLENMRSQGTQNAILIAMPKTPNRGDLPFVEKEIQELENLFQPSTIQTTIRQYPTKPDVLSLLRNHQVAHISCHGYVSTKDPSQSKLLLQDWETA